MFDTHCHLNFKAFSGKEKETIKQAKEAGVNFIVVPGTDLVSSEKAITLACWFPQVYAAVGIHPHHIYEIWQNLSLKSKNEKANNYLKNLKKLVKNKKVVAVGEVGLDRYFYQKTKYQNYQIDEAFINLQKEFLIRQIDLAIEYKKTLIVHNRLAKNDLLEILKKYEKKLIEEQLKIVFHCCEADFDLLNFAVKNHIFIGVDGDITYDKKKQGFVRKIPLNLLVLETDSPFLLPEPLKSQKVYPNQPKNLFLIARFIASLTKISFEKLIQQTTKNAKHLFRI